MESDVKATRITATGAVTTLPARLKGLTFLAGASAGTITLRDGGSGGTTLAVFDTPGSATWQGTIDLPGNGIQFRSDMHATLSNVTGVTFFYA